MYGCLRKDKGEGGGSFPIRKNVCVCVNPWSVSIMLCLSIVVYRSEVFLPSLNQVLICECAGHQWAGYKGELA